MNLRELAIRGRIEAVGRRLDGGFLFLGRRTRPEQRALASQLCPFNSIRSIRKDGLSDASEN
jgi:hypothetical protein